MLNRSALLTDLQKLLKKLENDLLERSESAELPEIGLKLREEFTAAQAAERTAQNYEDWRSDAITQVAAAWVLSCVFVRFLEDNGLIEPPRIGGPGERLQQARDEHELFFRARPKLNDRDYLLSVFDGLESYPATKELFGKHNPIRDLPNWLSGDAAGELLKFFQRVAPNTGVLVHDFTDSEWDTRFLGDLYQDLSEEARKKYALLQTPVFVEEFILDRTFDPAIEEFGLAKTGYETRLLPDGRLHPDDRFKMIDPACGSGHFLLGSFARLVDRWRRREPGTKTTVLVQRALDSVHGVDLNPYAVAIARFRLLLAALKECGIRRLRDAPGFEIHVACGDSLLHGGLKKVQRIFDEIDELKHVYQPEDPESLARILRSGEYHAVVANPPYITPKDRALNQAYRDGYATCHMKYSLAVPFLERIISLAVDGGCTGQITANSFMKREFGKKLIEGFFPRVDLTHVIDTSGAYIPGHGTPTVILLARNRRPVAGTIRTVMSIRGEPSTPADPARGLVWSAIVQHLDHVGSQSDFVSVADSPRQLFHAHPWSIGGGGAAELKEQLGAFGSPLSDRTESIGFMAILSEDEAFLVSPEWGRRRRIDVLPFCSGDDVRDWMVRTEAAALFPYSRSNLHALMFSAAPSMLAHFWDYRIVLRGRLMFGKRPEDRGMAWYEFMHFSKERFSANALLSFASVATHNQFSLRPANTVLNRHAPVIKLVSTSRHDDHLALLGLLNSSTACFWMKQVFFPKGGDHVGQHGARVRRTLWDERYEFAGTGLESFPLPEGRPDCSAEGLQELAETMSRCQPSAQLQRCEARGITPGGPVAESFEVSRREWSLAREQMIFLQEELDWECYRLYGLIEEELTQSRKAAKGDGTDLDAELPVVPPLELGQRAFEIVMARNMAAGELQTTWFDRHGSTPITELPAHWPNDYRRLVERRIELIESDPNIRLIEQPEYKRRWNTEPWESQLERALNNWLLDRLESYFDFDGRMNEKGKATAKLAIAFTTVGKLADIARQDTDFLQVGELYRNDPAFDVTRLVAELVEGESVPLLPILRYKASGLRKREEWTHTWTLQRQEDAIDARTKLPKDDPRHLSELDAAGLKKKEVGTIPVPPKYTSADFLKSHYWRLRGKLDVPKERWVSFPHCEGEDGSLTVAWAGYDHLQLAKAISEYYVDIQERLGGRDDPRLLPLLACLVELLPWLKQWHNEVDPEFGYRMGDYFEGFVQEEGRRVGKTVEEIAGWVPPQRARGKRSRGQSAGDKVE